MIKKETTNSFQDGLIMDLNPLTTPNNVLTSCLNGTIVTFNGNEHVLQTDMGNGKVGSAVLPQGYIPLGTTELGGIIYIVSYNPLTKKSQIGSFPSPERNIYKDDITEPQSSLRLLNFYDSTEPNAVVSRTQKLYLTERELHAGDKFYITSNNISNYKDVLSAVGTDNVNKNPNQLKLHVVSIQDDGKIVYLDDNLTWYEDYYIKEGDFGTTVPDEYRDLINANYNVFSSKTPGKLAILAELEAVDTFSVTLDYEVSEGKNVQIFFITNWTYDNPYLESQPLINPESIAFKVNGSSIENTDIIEVTDRKNDGTDQPVKVEGYKTNYTPLEDKILNFQLYPQMKYGYLKYLENYISVNLGLLGSGKTELNEYRYFIEDSMFTLSYGFEAYPEFNKRINSVKFDFFEFNSNIYNKITKEVDTSYLISKDNTISWNKGSSTPQLMEDGNPIYSFKNEQSSIMGHFSKQIYYKDSNLVANNCYLVKITVDYNGEEDRIYYRLLYTSPIFNTEYYNIDDFSTLKLKDYLNLELSIQSQDTEKNTERKFLNEEGKEILGIPRTISEDKSVKYTIKDTTNTSLDINVQVKLKYGEDPFKISIDEISSPSIVSESEIDPKKQQYILFPDSEFKMNNPNSSISDISQLVTEGTVHQKCKLTTVLETPIKITYDQKELIPIQYKMERFKGVFKYLNIYTSKKTVLVLHDDRIDDNAATGFKTSWDDSGPTWNDFGAIWTIGNALTDILKDNDWIAVCINLIYKTQTDRDQRLQIGTYDEKVLSRWNSIPNAIFPNLKYALMLFLMRNKNGSMTAFGIPNKIYGNTAVTPIEYTGNPNKQIKFLDLGTTENDWNTIRDKVIEEMQQYYKLVPYTGDGKNSFKYSNIIYWDNFNVITDILFKYSGKYSLKINEVLIDKESINNLLVDNSFQDLETKITLKDYIVIDTVISNIIKSFSGDYVKTEDEKGEQEAPEGTNPKTVYDKNMRTIKRILNGNSQTGLNLGVSNEQAYIEVPSNADIQRIYGHLEEQSFFINNIVTA